MRFGKFLKLDLAVALALAAPLMAHAAEPVDGRYRVKIHAQPLGAALQELANQSGIQIIFFSKLTEGHNAPALNGSFTPASALGTLLRGTDLTFNQINAKTIEVLSHRAARKTPQNADETQTVTALIPEKDETCA